MSNLKTKPFNLEEALAGKPVVTRDGQQVKKITKFDVNKTNPYSVYALVDEIIGNWTETGKYVAGTPEENPLDLFMKIEGKSIWVNVYDTINGLFLLPHSTEQEAKQSISMSHPSYIYIKTIQITDDNE